MADEVSDFESRLLWADAQLDVARQGFACPIVLGKPLGMVLNPDGLVTKVVPEGQAEVGGITPGCRVLTAGGQAARSLPELKAAVAAAKARGDADCPVVFQDPRRTASLAAAAAALRSQVAEARRQAAAAEAEAAARAAAEEAAKASAVAEAHARARSEAASAAAARQAAAAAAREARGREVEDHQRRRAAAQAAQAAREAEKAAARRSADEARARELEALRAASEAASAAAAADEGVVEMRRLKAAQHAAEHAAAVAAAAEEARQWRVVKARRKEREKRDRAAAKAAAAEALLPERQRLVKQCARAEAEASKARTGGLTCTVFLSKPLGMVLNPDGLVTKVVPEGQAEAGGITPGCRVLTAGGQVAGSLPELKAAVAAAKARGEVDLAVVFVDLRKAAVSAAEAGRLRSLISALDHADAVAAAEEAARQAVAQEVKAREVEATNELTRQLVHACKHHVEFGAWVVGELVGELCAGYAAVDREEERTEAAGAALVVVDLLAELCGEAAADAASLELERERAAGAAARACVDAICAEVALGLAAECASDRFETERSSGFAAKCCRDAVLAELLGEVLAEVAACEQAGAAAEERAAAALAEDLLAEVRAGMRELSWRVSCVLHFHEWKPYA